MKIQDIPTNIRIVCPLTLPRPDGPYACCEKKCAWCCTFYPGRENEYFECAVKSLACLKDMI